MKKSLLTPTLLLFLAVALLPVYSQRKYPPVIECDRIEVFKSIDSIDLRIWIFNPSQHGPGSSAPAIVFFFGGGWSSGSPEQFVSQSKYLASRGMVAMVADYRVASRNNVKANKCVSDAKSAVRWVREHASELGVDPDRIATGGGSAGGHLAAAVATLPGFDEPEENAHISSKPNAMVLFNPALVLAPVKELEKDHSERLARLEGRLGTKPEEMSPYHHIVKGLPPTIIFHGTADSTVSFKTVELFNKKMKQMGNHCTLVGYKDEGHGFFNFGRGNNGAYISTVQQMDAFLVSVGYLSPPPEYKEY